VNPDPERGAELGHRIVGLCDQTLDALTELTAMVSHIDMLAALGIQQHAHRVAELRNTADAWVKSIPTQEIER